MKKQLIAASAATALIATTFLSAVVQAAESPAELHVGYGKTVEQRESGVPADRARAPRDLQRPRLGGDEARQRGATIAQGRADGRHRVRQSRNDLRVPPTGHDAAWAPSSATRSAGPTTWLPVGADVTITDSLTQSPSKAKAIASANEHLKKGKREAALSALKVANINVAYTMELVPLKQTMTDINQAASLLAQNKSTKRTKPSNRWWIACVMTGSTWMRSHSRVMRLQSQASTRPHPVKVI